MKFERLEWKTFDTLYALDSFANYWSENEKLIKKAAGEEEQKYSPKWTPKDDDEFGEYLEELRMARHLHDEIMTPMFRYSSIVMLYTIVERELRRLVVSLENDRGKQKLGFKELRGSFLQQTGKFAEVFFGLSLTSCPDYNAVCDLQKIRDCIVHCRGEVNLVNENDRKYLLKLKDVRPGFFAWEGTDVEIGPECVELFIKETWRFFIWIFGELKWKIDDSWQGNKWATLTAGTQQPQPEKAGDKT